MENMRIQLELPEARVQELKKLMEEAGFDTYKDLFNNSLTLFEWAVNEVKNGKVLGSMDEQNEKFRVLVMPFLERIANAARKAEQPAYNGASR
jgi:hypothetical protein